MAETWKEEWPKKSQQGERQDPWQEQCGRVKTRTWVGKLMQTLAGMMVTSPTGMPGAAGAAAFVETVLHYDAGMNSCFVQHLLQLFQRCAFKHDKEEFYILLHSECHASQSTGWWRKLSPFSSCENTSSFSCQPSVFRRWDSHDLHRRGDLSHGISTNTTDITLL